MENKSSLARCQAARGSRIRAALSFLCFIFSLGAPPARSQTADSVLDAITDTVSQVTDLVLSDITRFRIGAGPVFIPDFEGSDSNELKFRPVLSLRYRDLILLDNNRIRLNVVGSDVLIASKHFKVGPLLEVGFGRDASDNSDLHGLDDIGTSVELGVFVSYSKGAARARVRVQKDVASGHSGVKIIPDLRLMMYRSEKLVVAGSLGSVWTDNEYMNTFFGISEAQSPVSGLPAFTATSGFKNVNLTLGANYSISDKWSVLASARYARLLGDAADSPIVSMRGSPNQSLGAVFIMYDF